MSQSRDCASTGWGHGSTSPSDGLWDGWIDPPPSNFGARSGLLDMGSVLVFMDKFRVFGFEFTWTGWTKAVQPKFLWKKLLPQRTHRTQSGKPQPSDLNHRWTQILQKGTEPTK